MKKTNTENIWICFENVSEYKINADTHVYDISDFISVTIPTGDTEKSQWIVDSTSYLWNMVISSDSKRSLQSSHFDKEQMMRIVYINLQRRHNQRNITIYFCNSNDACRVSIWTYLAAFCIVNSKERLCRNSFGWRWSCQKFIEWFVTRRQYLTWVEMEIWQRIEAMLL